MKKILTLILLLSTSVTHADFDAGVLALTTGNYDQALQSLMPLAETADHAYAQYFLGRMFAAGQGVDQNTEVAAKWYRKAAEQGVADAQYRLGDLYRNGDGVPKDMEYAYAWFSVAAQLGNAKGTTAFAESTQQLSADELKQATKLSQNLIEKYGVVPESTSHSPSPEQ